MDYLQAKNLIPPPRPLHNLTKAQRDATPIDFADYLISRLRLEMGSIVLAALWVASDTVYRQFKGVEVWDLKQDALKYKGPWPIVAHPPCGPWGYLINMSHETDEHGIRAMEYVHQYGGVVEQPKGSQLFKQYGSKRGQIEELFQYDFGHLAQKRTILYWYKPRRIETWHRKTR